VVLPFLPLPLFSSFETVSTSFSPVSDYLHLRVLWKAESSLCFITLAQGSSCLIGDFHHFSPCGWLGLGDLLPFSLRKIPEPFTSSSVMSSGPQPRSGAFFRHIHILLLFWSKGLPGWVEGRERPILPFSTGDSISTCLCLSSLPCSSILNRIFLICQLAPDLYKGRRGKEVGDELLYPSLDLARDRTSSFHRSLFSPPPL